jgi:hypothetical protein
MADLAKSGAGVFVAMVSMGTNLTEKAMGIPLGLVKTVRDEVFRATYAGVDFIEGLNQSSFKVVRDVLQRVDKLSQEAVTGLESVTGSVTKVIRGSGDVASEFVSQTAMPRESTKESSRATASA